MFKDFYFDYVFYRLYKWNVSPMYKQIFPLFIIGGLQAIFCIGVLLCSINLCIDRAVYSQFSDFIGLTVGLLAIILTYLNYRRFYGRVDELEQRWHMEQLSVRIIKGALVIFNMFLSFVPLVLSGYI